ncbi:MAG: hypothetical protein ACYTFA_17720 [Planctomycetota bacterium]|jgi:hypothetical protein
MQGLTRILVIGMLGASFVGISTAWAGDAPATVQVPPGAAMTAVATRTAGRAGEVFTVDIYLSNINDLGGYQIRLKTSGGTQGSLTLSDALIDSSRKDYVYGPVQILDVVNKTAGVMMAIRAVPVSAPESNVGKPRYAGTFKFTASADAKGVFTIVAEKGPDASMVTNSIAQDIPFTTKAATITIGAVPKRPTTRR